MHSTRTYFPHHNSIESDQDRVLSRPLRSFRRYRCPRHHHSLLRARELLRLSATELTALILVLYTTRHIPRLRTPTQAFGSRVIRGRDGLVFPESLVGPFTVHMSVFLRLQVKDGDVDEMPP